MAARTQPASLAEIKTPVLVLSDKPYLRDNGGAHDPCCPNSRAWTCRPIYLLHDCQTPRSSTKSGGEGSTVAISCSCRLAVPPLKSLIAQISPAVPKEKSTLSSLTNRGQAKEAPWLSGSSKLPSSCGLLISRCLCSKDTFVLQLYRCMQRQGRYYSEPPAGKDRCSPALSSSCTTA